MKSSIEVFDYIDQVIQEKPRTICLGFFDEVPYDQAVELLHKAQRREREEQVNDPMLMANLANAHTRAQEAAPCIALVPPERQGMNPEVKGFWTGCISGLLTVAATILALAYFII